MTDWSAESNQRWALKRGLDSSKGLIENFEALRLHPLEQEERLCFLKRESDCNYDFDFDENVIFKC